MVGTATRSNLYTTRTLTDRKVVSTSGERLGEIQDIVVDASRGCISYAVLAYTGGLLGMNRKHFAVPWQAFKIDEAHRDLVLDVDEQMLKDSPGFDRDEWPTQPDESFASDVHSYYGYEYPQQRGEMQQGGYTQQQEQYPPQEGGMRQGGYGQQQEQYPPQEGGYSEPEGARRRPDEDDTVLPGRNR